MCKARFTVCAVLIFLLSCAAVSWAQYSGGSGAAGEPYQITTPADWQQLMDAPADWDKHFVLTADIDLNDVAIMPIAPDANTSSHFQGTQFTGVFDGNDHIIRNVDINRPESDYVGLFGYVGQTGQIANLGVENVAIRGKEFVGGLVGYNNSGNIDASYTTGPVEGVRGVGGLVGWNYSYVIITNCYTTGPVSGDERVGGLVGMNDYGGIINSYSTASVDANKFVGGLVGSNRGRSINCYSTGSVSGTSSYVAGLVGWNAGSVINCYSTGLVSGTDSYVGGLVGRNYDTISDSFWDVNTSGWTTSNGGAGRTTVEMEEINTFLEAGWDFGGESANGTCNFWLMPQGRGYPVLSTLSGYIPPEPPGSGSQAAPYIITDANGLGTVWYRPSAYYVLGSDIDLAGISWRGPLILWFRGVFDGNDHIIRNVDVNSPGGHYVGLFGYMEADGQIKNVGIEGISIFGDHCVGGLVGLNNYGAIMDCYSTGLVGGWDCVGGLVGENYGAITNCYSTGLVSGTDDLVGGLVGMNYGPITNCYSTSLVNGSSFTGGLVGSVAAAGSIGNSHSTGSVSGTGAYVGGLVGGIFSTSSTVSNCYSTGSVSGFSYVGGLAGWNHGEFISKCYSRGSVGGSDCVGGLVGRNKSPISNCYSRSSVTGTGSHVGGLVGWHYSGPINNCYSTGLVGGIGDYVGGLSGCITEGRSIQGCFWDVNTSRRATSSGGKGKTTGEMQDPNTFVSAGWDFVGESGNGAEDIWSICEGANYPRFAWQIPAADWLCPDGVGLEDFGHFGGFWGTAEGGAVNLDDEDGIGFGDLMIFCREWLNGR